MTRTFRYTNPDARARDEERRRFRVVLLWLLALYALVFVVACNGSDGNPVSPTPQPTAPAPPAPRVIRQGTIPFEAPTSDYFQFFVIPIIDATPGRWEATVDWSNEANTLWMWVAEGVCSVEQFSNEACPFDAACPCRFAIRSETATPKPRVLTIPSAAGGTRTLIIGNLGPHADTAQFRVTVTGSAAITGDSTHAASVSPVSTALKTFRSKK